MDVSTIASIASDYQWLANFGFAAVAFFYVLGRIEPAINRLDKSIRLLTLVVAKSTGEDPAQIERDYIANGGDSQKW